MVAALALTFFPLGVRFTSARQQISARRVVGTRRSSSRCFHTPTLDVQTVSARFAGIRCIYTYSLDTQRYERLTDFGEHPQWLRDNRHLLFFSQGKLYRLDSQRRKTQELLSVAPNQFQSLGISHDNRTIYYSLKAAEADIWLASLEAEP